MVLKNQSSISDLFKNWQLILTINKFKSMIFRIPLGEKDINLMNNLKKKDKNFVDNNKLTINKINTLKVIFLLHLDSNLHRIK